LVDAFLRDRVPSSNRLAMLPPRRSKCLAGDAASSGVRQPCAGVLCRYLSTPLRTDTSTTERPHRSRCSVRSIPSRVPNRRRAHFIRRKSKSMFVGTRTVAISGGTLAQILPLPIVDPRPTSDWRRRRRWPMMKRSSTGLKGQPAKPPEQARHSVQAEKVHQPPCSGLIAGLQIRFAKTTQFYSSSTRFLCCNDMNPSNARLPVHTMRMAPAIMKASRFWANRGIVRSAGVSRGKK
jgi:hypothetical protein